VTKRHTTAGIATRWSRNPWYSRGSGRSTETRGRRNDICETTRIRLFPGGLLVVRIRRPIGDALISIGALAILLAVLVSVDERVRQQVSLRLTGGSAQAELRGAGVQVQDVAAVIIDAARHQSIEHAPMMLFVVAASVLFLFMLRT
jgi:hypothetical protein